MAEMNTQQVQNGNLTNGTDQPQVNGNVKNEPEQQAAQYNTAFPLFGGGAAQPVKKQLNSITKKTGSLVGRKITRPGGNNIRRVLEIPSSERKYPSSGGSSMISIKQHIRQVENDKKVTVNVNQSSSNLKLTICGNSEDSVKQAFTKLKMQLQSQEVYDLDISKQYHKFILGKNGRALREIEENTSTRVRIPGTNDDNSKISITGSREGIESAKQKMLAIVRQQGERTMEKLDIPKIYHPFISGPNMKTKTAIEQSAGACKINIPPNNKPDVSEITITGHKDSVRIAVEKVNEIYLRKKDKLNEIAVPISKQSHRHVVGPKAVWIHDILDKFEVVVDVPPQNSDSESIGLRGEQQHLGHALNMVLRLANSYTTNFISAPGWCMNKLIGKGGERINDLNPFNDPKSDQFVRVDFKKENNDIEISGRVENVDIVEKKIQEAVDAVLMEFSTREIEIPQALHGRVIGVKGANLLKLKEGKEGLNIRVPDSNNQSDKITIEGKKNDVDEVHHRLTLIRDDLKNEKEVILNFDNKYHAYFFRTDSGPDRGKKEAFDKIQNRFGKDQVNIQFPPRGNRANDVKVRGHSKFVDMVSKDLQRLYEQIVNEHYTGTLLVMKRFHKNIIGKNGAVINQIKDECNVQIDMPGGKNSEYSGENKTSDEMIKITGTKANVERAKAQIREIENKEAAIAEIKVKIPKSAYKFLIGQKGVAIMKLKTEFDVAIQFPDEKSASDEVTIRGEEPNIKRAEKRLVELANDKIENFFTIEVECPKDNRKFLVGKRGVFKKGFEDDNNVGLNIPDAEDAKIQVVGKKQDVEKAVILLNGIIKKLKNKREVETTIPKVHHKRLITGGHMRIFQDEFSVNVQLPPQDKMSDEVRVSGPENNVDQVVQKLKILVDGYDNESTLVLNLPTKDRRALIGDKGATVNGLQHEFNVFIGIKPKFDEETNEETGTEATITGPSDQLEAVKKRLMTLVTYNEEYELPVEYHGLLLGNRGDHVRQLSEQLHVTIKVPKKGLADQDDEDNSKRNTITLRGNEENLANARIKLDEKRTEWDNTLNDLYLKSYTCPVEVPQMFHRKLIGRNGDNVKNIQNRNGNVMIRTRKPDAEDNEGIITIDVTGYKENVESCVAEITKFIDDLENEVVKTIEIDSDLHLRIIGQKGRGVRKIMNDFSVSLEFPQRDSPNKEDQNKIKIIGSCDAVDSCADHLANLEIELLRETGDDEIDERYKPSTPGQSELIGQQYSDNRRNNRKEQREPRNKQVFQVQNAPWNQPVEGNTKNESFPTLGGPDSTRNDTWGKGAWGRK